MDGNHILVYVPNSMYAAKALSLMVKSYNLLNLLKQAAYYRSIYNKTLGFLNKDYIQIM